jgi:hypothetical protein
MFYNLSRREYNFCVEYLNYFGISYEGIVCFFRHAFLIRITVVYVLYR